MYVEEARAERAGAGERIDKQGEPEMQREVKAAQVTCIEGADSGQCKTGKCINIGEDRVCTDCGKAGEVPINGKCVAYNNDLVTTAGCTKNNGDPVDASSTTCGKCTKTGYFLHKGGCYLQTATPGSTICTTAGSTAGICEACQAGYFKNPANVATSDSCIACNDATGVTVGSATYKGVLNCAACTTPQAGGSGEVATCTVCVDGYYGADCTGNCNESCKSCNGAEATACTSCKTGNNKEYLKVTDPQARTGECVADEDTCKASNTHFLVADTKTCYPCGSVTDGGVADCAACTSSESGGADKATTVTCSACTTPTKKPNADGTKCVDCAAAGCAKCSDEGVCAACDSSHYLTPTSQCVDKCDKLGGYYADSQRVCQPCDPSCASCVGANANQCSACPAGKVLQYTDDTPANGGSCVDECRTNTGGCDICGAVIGGSKYCSKCSDASQAPLNGNCTANTPRTKFCTNASNGACTQCANGYFLLENGCYKTDRQPGSQVCKTEGSGKCTTCANEQTPDSSGVCPACPVGCSKCSDSGSSQTCSECLAGYYKSGTKCVKCNTTDGSITGVENCVSCTPPTGNTGTVTCYVTQEPTVDPTDPSVNKGGLSSGAIAGISVAVIAVVGGLVGFLCWWFVCRGKA